MSPVTFDGRLGRNPEIVNMFPARSSADKPARLLAAPGPGFGSIIWIRYFGITTGVKVVAFGPRHCTRSSARPAFD
jgi:hypothetical protein